MNTNKTTWVTIAVIVIVLLVGAGFYASYRANHKQQPASVDQNTYDQQALETVNVKHQYKDGKHTFAGTFQLPTPCDAISQKVVKDATNAKKFTIAFTTTNTSDVCAQVVTSRTFKIVFEGPKDAQVKATLNGKEFKMNIFEVSAGEDLDAFDINIKG